MADGRPPRRDWILIPPAWRPFVAALSAGVVALFIWDRVVTPEEPALLHPPGAKVVTSEQAPIAQLNVSSLAASGGDAANVPPPGAPRGDGRAAGRPLDAPASPAPMTEEERSQRNEQMILGLEKQKRSMGIRRVLPKKEQADGTSILGETDALPAPAVRDAAPPLLKDEADAPAPRRPAGLGRVTPEAGLVFSDARDLSTSWVVLGMPGDPPAPDFSRHRLAVLKVPGTKIVSVTVDGTAWTVSYRSLLSNETPDPSKDRVALIAPEPKPIRFVDVSSR